MFWINLNCNLHSSCSFKFSLGKRKINLITWLAYLNSWFKREIYWLFERWLQTFAQLWNYRERLWMVWRISRSWGIDGLWFNAISWNEINKRRIIFKIIKKRNIRIKWSKLSTYLKSRWNFEWFSWKKKWSIPSKQVLIR